MFSSKSIRVVATMAFVVPTISACSDLSAPVHLISAGPGIQVAAVPIEKAESDGAGTAARSPDRAINFFNLIAR